MSNGKFADWNDRHKAHGFNARKTKQEIDENTIEAMIKDAEGREKIHDNAELDKFNQQYFVIGNYFGKCVIGEFVPFYNKVTRCMSTKLVVQRREEFFARFANKFIDVSKNPLVKKYENIAVAWFRHPNRHYYDKAVLAPGEKTPPNILNLWRGFTCEAIEGNCSRITNFI